MIVDAIIHAVLGFLSAILSVLPNIPAMPSDITTPATWIIGILSQGALFVQFLYGSAFFIAIISVVTAIWAFEPAYHGIMWVIKKIPFLAVK